MSSSLFLLCLLPCLAVCLPNRPHILLVLMDDQGYNDVGFTYPGRYEKDLETPLIDGLAEEGLILDRFYTAWLCTPARASLMTGRYPLTLGIQDELFQSNTEQCLDEGEILMPEPIRANGYATHMVGKWHLGYARWSCLPCGRGFNSAYGYTQGTIDYMTHETTNSWHDFYSCSDTDAGGKNVSINPGTNGNYSMELYARRILQILDDHNPEQPLFLYLPLQTVHSSGALSNYFAPQSYFSEWCNDTAHPRCTMQAMLNAAEDTLNTTISKFKELGMWNNTLMLYMSDNGGLNDSYHSNRPLKGYKFQQFEGGIRTPAFLYSANQDILAVRGRTACYVHISDWYSTLVEFTGGWDAYTASTGKVPISELDSINQLELLITGELDTCQRTEIMVNIDPVRRTAVYIKEDFKLLFGNQWDHAKCKTNLFYPFNVSGVDWSIVQLYNITGDAAETTNLAEYYPDVVQQLYEVILLFMDAQEPLKCQLPDVDNSFPNEVVPFCLPWDFPDGVTPSWATYALLD